MLLRERAWDVMRTDMATVSEDMSLRDVAKVLRAAMKERGHRACAVVLSETGGFKGVVTAWWLLLYMEQCALKDAPRLGAGREGDDAFRTMCRKCFSVRAGEMVERDVPVVKPQDPLFVVLGAMLSSRRRWAVVMEGGKALGLIAAEDVFMQLDFDDAEA